MASATYRDAVKIVTLCIAWYTVSATNNIVGKIILNEFPYPMTLSMVQLATISLSMIPVLKLWSVPSASMLPVKYWFTMIIPLAAGKFFSSVSSHISIWKVPVSYAHTVKATMPLFTVFLSRIILGERQTLKVYCSLLPIILGVLIATATEISFDIIGLVSALVSTLGFAVQNIFSKKCLRETGIHHLRLLVLLARISAVCFLPLWLLYDVPRIIEDTSFLNSPQMPRVMALLVIDGFCNAGQNVVAFTIISMVSPLSYAVANASKRISVITASLLTLRNPITLTNILGMLIAILGVLFYNKTKYDANQEQRKETILPVTSSHQNGKPAIIDDTPSILLQDHFDRSSRIQLWPSSNGYVSRQTSASASNGGVPQIY